jgi:hypothetical protein
MRLVAGLLALVLPSCAADVRAFGAIGDGVADDSAAISAAIADAVATRGPLQIPRGRYRFSAGLDFGSSNLHVVCEAGAILQFTGAGPAVTFGATAPHSVNNIGMEECTIEGNAAATDGIVLHRAHHVMFRNVSVRNVTGACLRTRFSVAGTYTNFRCSNSESPLAVQASSGIVLGEDGPGEQTTAGTFLTPIVEGVTGNGIVLDSAANLVFTGGTSENNHGGWGMTVGARSTNITVIGMDFEDNAAGSVESYGTELLFVNVLAAGTFQMRSGARGNTIANSRIDQVIFDPGTYNNVMRENDYAIEDGRAEPIDHGTNNSIFGNYNAGTQRYAAGYIRFPVSPASALLAAADRRGATLRVTGEWSDVSTYPVSTAWRAVFIGSWNAVEAEALTEVTAGDAALAINSGTVLFRRDEATLRLQARTDAQSVQFTGAFAVVP